MRAALLALNEIEKQGVIANYAIGGAIAATFYIEPTNTSDVDVFVLLEPAPGALLLSLTPIYDALKALGGQVVKEHIVIDKWAIQVLATEPGLTQEALEAAQPVMFSDVPTRVFTAEHLCAIALQTGRAKDYLRVSMFIDSDAVNMHALNGLVHKYGLAERRAKVMNWPEGMTLEPKAALDKFLLEAGDAYSVSPTDNQGGWYCGQILYSDWVQWAVQHKGGNAVVVHDIRDWQEKPQEGDMAEIQYRDGVVVRLDIGDRGLARE